MMARRSGTTGSQMILGIGVMILVSFLMFSGPLTNVYSTFAVDTPPMPTEGYFGVNLIDGMTYEQLSNATIAVFNDAGDFLGYCQRTDKGILASPFPIYVGEKVTLMAWDDNHYPVTMEWVMPDFSHSNINYVPLSMELYNRCENFTVRTVSPTGVYPVNITEDGDGGLITIIFNMLEEDSKFGADWYDARVGKFYVGAYLILRSTVSLPINNYAGTYAGPSYIYYYFHMGEVRNDADIPTDGYMSYNIAFDFFIDANMSIAIVDTLWEEELHFNTLDFGGDILTCSNGILNITDNTINVKNGFKPTYVYPPYYIDVEDLYVDVGVYDGGGDGDNYPPPFIGGLITDEMFICLLAVVGVTMLGMFGNDYISRSRRKRRRGRDRIRDRPRRVAPADREYIEEITPTRDVKHARKTKTTINDVNHTTDDDGTYYGFR